MSPYASAAFDGTAILMPGMCMNHDSRLCECCGPMPIRDDDRRPDHERHRELAAGEVVELRGLVEDLVHRDADEVEELDLAHRAHARDREADRVADGARLAERRVADPSPRRTSRRARA